uniref:ADP-ribosylation factor 1 n=1 Tax=Quercus lobata TaxID=97700 RepID=A0A7N2L2P5_QUELO
MSLLETPRGANQLRPYWRCYFPNTQAIIYVVDSSDTDRLVIAKDEFHAILEDPPQGMDQWDHPEGQTPDAYRPSLSRHRVNLEMPRLGVEPKISEFTEEELRGAVVLIFANKQDLPGALDDAAVTEALELHKIKNRQWAIFKTSAIKGEGLFEGLDWIGTFSDEMSLKIYS